MFHKNLIPAAIFYEDVTVCWKHPVTYSILLFDLCGCKDTVKMSFTLTDIQYMYMVTSRDVNWLTYHLTGFH